jgi:hypothetical protein
MPEFKSSPKPAVGAYSGPGSMALATTLHPSHTLLCLTLLMYAVANAASGFAIYRLGLAGWLGGILFALILGFSSVALFRFLLGRRSAYLEISDTGSIILRCLDDRSEVVSSALVGLDARSSYSEYVLILHLRMQDAALVVIPVLRDSVSADDFRKLSIALRWIAQHAASEQDRILEDASGNF